MSESGRQCLPSPGQNKSCPHCLTAILDQLVLESAFLLSYLAVDLDRFQKQWEM